MYGINKFSPSPNPTGKPDESNTNNTKAASTEVQMFNYKGGYDLTIGEVAKKDGGDNPNELDGKLDVMITQLENLRNKYKGKIPKELDEDIQDKIVELNMQKLAYELSYNNFGNKTERQIERIMEQKISKLSMKECEYLLNELNPIYELYTGYGDQDNPKKSLRIVMQSKTAIQLVKDRRIELDPSLSPFYELSFNE